MDGERALAALPLDLQTVWKFTYSRSVSRAHDARASPRTDCLVDTSRLDLGATLRVENDLDTLGARLLGDLVSERSEDGHSTTFSGHTRSRATLAWYD